MHFVIWTTNKPKSEAIEQVLGTCSYTKWRSTYSNYKVNSGVPDMPLTLRDIRNGAKNRARSLREIEPNADYYIGMEWWVYRDYEWIEYWLIGVVYIENQSGEGNYGYSCHLQVPEKVIKLLLDGSNRDLEQVVHSLWWEENIGDKHGSYHVWTDGMLSRREQFIMATQCAIAPFFNKYYQS